MLLGVAFLLRAWHPDNVAVEHFDEGVYASNFFSAHLDFRYPNSHLYAPPLFPAMLEWTLILTGGVPHSVMWVNVFWGTAMVAAIWWFTRLISNDTAAFAAGTLAAFNDFFIQYSRTALTDTPLTCFIILAVGSGMIALRGGNSLALLASAMFTALAWWTKYNGWLPLAILGAGLGGWIIVERPKPAEWLPCVGRFLVIGLGAFLFWLPCLWGLQEFGGYKTVAQNHAGYVVGIAGWWDSLLRQLTVQAHYGARIPVAILLACVVAFQPISPPDKKPFLKIRNQRRSLILLTIMAFIVLLTRLDFLMLVAVACWGVASLFQFARSGPSSPATASKLPRWILLAWICGLMVASPLYRPYPRLLLPLVSALVISAGIGIGSVVGSMAGVPKCAEDRRLNFSHLGLLILIGMFMLMSFRTPLYQARTDLRSIAQAIPEEMATHSLGTSTEIDAVVYVVGEPGLYYHLASAHASPLNFIAQPASNLAALTPKPNAPPIPTFIAIGPHAPVEMALLAEQTDRATLIREFPYRPSDLVLLDEVPPAELEGNRQRRIQLWKVTQK